MKNHLSLLVWAVISLHFFYSNLVLPFGSDFRLPGWGSSHRGVTVDPVLRSRLLENYLPCDQYGNGMSLPEGHPCAGTNSEADSTLIPHLIGLLRRGNPDAGKRPPGSGKRPPGSGKRPPGSGKRPPGSGKRPPGSGRHPFGKGHHPPRKDGSVRCRLNRTKCLDPALNVYLKIDDTAVTCCRTKCVSLFNSSRNCGVCGLRCRRRNGGLDCCDKKCTNLLTDNLNCGTCGVLCSANTFCANGTCVVTNY